MIEVRDTGLNPEQQAAVEHADGPLQLIAGAGTGKTFTLTERVANLVRTGRAEPGEILALTFTDKAAAEMVERINKAIRPLSKQQARVSTYNAFGGSIVEEFGTLLGLPPGLRTFTPPESWILLWRSLDEIDFRHVDLFNLKARWASPLRDILALNSRLKDELVESEQLASYVDGLAGDEEGEKLADYARAIEVYTQKLREHGAIDFGDQIALAVELLRMEQVARTCHERYKYLLVDEFQDTNYAQSEMVRLLAGDRANVCVVGDPKQAIYGFRGAAPDNIDRFRETFRGVVRMTLRQNYRSTQEVLDVANSVWTDGSGRLVSADGKRGQRVVEAVLPDQQAEAEYIATEIERLLAQGVRYGGMAVLLRKNDLKLRMWHRLRALGVPAEIVGGSDLFRTPEVREVLSYMRALDDPTDSVSLAHALVSCVWGYDEAKLLPLAREVEREKPLLDVLRERADQEEIGSPARRFLAAFDRLLTLRARASLSRLIEEVLSLRQTSYDELEEANVRRFKSFAYGFASNQVGPVGLTDLLAYVDLLLAAGSDEEEAQGVEDTDTVKLMTVHAAKGLEWGVVFVAGASEPDFTTRRSSDVLPRQLAHQPVDAPRIDDYADEKQYAKALDAWSQEQHRLEDLRVFYVALTRARQRLYVTRSKLPTYYRKERQPLSFFERAGALCERCEPESFESTPGAAPLRNFAHAHIAGLSFDEHPSTGLAGAWSEHARTHGLSRAERVISDAMVRWDDEVSSVRRWMEDWEHSVSRQERAEPVTYRGRSSLSFTQISTFQQCQRKYYLRYVQGLPGLPEKWRTQAGSAFHSAVERYAQLRARGEEVPYDELVRWYRDGLGAEASDAKKLQDGLSFLRAYWDGPDRHAVPLMVEEEFYLPVGSGFIHGFIDRVQQLPDGRIELVDYKTNRRAKSESEVRADLQLPIYLLACREVLGIRPDVATMFFVRHNRRVSIRFTESELDSCRAQLEELVAQLAVVDKEHVDISNCRWCEYRLACSYSVMAHAS